MTKPQENSDAMTEPVLQPAAEPSPGETLRSARESRGLSQAQVGEALHLTVHFINALENDQYKKLPGRTFAKGYVRSYARLLQIDAEEVVARFERYMDAREEPQTDNYRSISRRRHHDQNVRWLAVATCLLLLVVGGAWWFGRDMSGSTQTAPRLAQQQPAIPGSGAAGQNADAGLSVANEEAPPAPSFDAALEEGAIGGGTPAELSAAQPDDSAITDSGVAREGEVAGETPAAAVAASGAEPAESGASSPAIDSSVASGAPAAGADTPAASVAQAGATPPPDAAAAASPAPALSVQSSEGRRGRQLSLGGEGDDTLVVTLHGTSWLAVRNHENNALFNDNLHDGDELTLRGQAPFNLVIGDAHQVQLRFNARPVDLSSHIRADRTARLSLQP